MAENTDISKYNGDNKAIDIYEQPDNAAVDIYEKPTRLNSFIYFLFCFILVFSNVAYGAVDFWALGLLSVFSGLIIIFWLSDAIVKKEFNFNVSFLQVPLLGLIVIGLIQLLPLRSSDSGGLLSIPTIGTLSLDASATKFAIANLVIYFIFFAAGLFLINSRKRFRKTVFLIFIYGGLMAFFGILQRFANLEFIYGLRSPGQAIFFGSYVNQHHFAAFMEMTIGVTLGLIFGKSLKKDKNLLLIICVVIMGIALLLTSSRGGYIGLLSVITFIVSMNLFQKRKQNNYNNEETENSSNFRRNFTLIGGGLALILGLFAAMILLGGNESLLRGTGLQNTQADFTNGRFHFWQIALKIFFDNPILGTGLNSFGTVFTHYDTWNGNYRIEQAHNDYLQILADAGIIGFTCVVGFIVLLFKKSFQIIGKTKDNFRRNVAIGALAGCFGILLHSFFDFPLRTSSNAFFFLTLVILATTNYPKSRNIHTS